MASVNPDKERPFVPQKLWSTVYMIRALYGRAAILIEWSYQRRQLQNWRTHKLMDQTLRAIIPGSVVDEIKKQQIGGLHAAVEYMQSQFLIDAESQG